MFPRKSISGIVEERVPLLSGESRPLYDIRSLGAFHDRPLPNFDLAQVHVNVAGSTDGGS